MEKFHQALLVWIISATVPLTGCALMERSPILESHFNRGVELYDKGKFAEAIEEYKLALRNNPDDFFAMYNLAVVYQDQEKFDLSTDLYKKILRITEDANSRINLASIYYNRGDREMAFHQLRAAADTNRDTANPLSAMGEYLEQENKLEEAKKKYLEALSIDDQHALTYYRLGRLYLKQGQSDSGVENLQKSIELAPEEPAYMETLAEEFESTNRPREAIHFFERISVLEPDREDIYIRLGNLYKREQLFKEAISRYWSALAIEKDNEQVHRSLLEIYGQLTQIERAKLESLEPRGSLAQTP